MQHSEKDVVLITGSTGMLGRYVMAALRDAGSKIVVSSRSDADLTDPQQVYEYVRRVRPNAILHLAAETDVDLCERDPQRAGLANHLSTDSVARAAAEVDAWLLYVSTSNVFGSEGKLLYNELDLPSPTNYYGRSKLQGEIAVRQRLPDNHLIVRAGWMIGGGPQHDHKFVGKVIKQLRDGADTLRAVTDKFGSLTRASALAQFILNSMTARRTGTLHFCSSGVITRLDVARAIAKMLAFRGSIVGVQSSMFPLSAPRPQSEGMESVYLTDAGSMPGNWEDDLSAYLNEFGI
jgi:dTDP-4-dehydrorhamnose reductase